ncbi:UDP-N-acetylglucosamine 1-carboxyvinyltransferase [endosymbiont 'TC1' of Trimyema compressum]|uniref:UDP-N-acetylglucosamine 1-carboxyvinyltransferase n=1 Tax=endosymbiont 'TC1' of Trimyema compressum TaxID=243899 RepID=UPI0007F1517C|nr:UDP-N-acetylglucosamine 1-carboxyvinyltransferase [endosymbiont 'TC1' of Trimyema compressum]AMP19796.1 UDP-N-acetylglucosamine 1-carboxyvinyltransferase [endosymbiont 'TC1' of Trimyema compressum]
MEKIVVKGGNPLKGTISIKGSKNSVLPILTAALLASDGVSVIHDVPKLSDVYIIIDILEHLGAKCSWDGNTVTIDSTKVVRLDASLNCVGDMRASFLLLGPLLARFKSSEILQPGGCAIGVRPIDLHLKGLEALGADFAQTHGVIKGSTQGLKGARIYLDFPSVGATENLMMAGALAEGLTILENVAEEPEIVDLANFLNNMGAKITGAGTNIIKIKGVPSLKGTVHTVIPDRIEAGTYMIAVGAAGGDAFFENTISDHLKPVVAKLREAGVTVIEEANGIRIISEGSKFCKGLYIKTMPYPGFPTDMQSQLLAMLLCSNGRSYVTETIFESRFQHIEEFRKMGADIILAGNTVALTGVDKIYGANVNATDLRAGAALIIAGLYAEGETHVGNIHFIDRGYDGLVENLKALGADIKRAKFDE